MSGVDFGFFCTKCPYDNQYREQNCFLGYRTRHFTAGEHIAYRGEVARELSIVVSGRVKTEILFDSGISYTSSQHTPPYPLGAIAIFAEQNYYRADFVALENCTMLSVTKQQLEEQMVKCRYFLRSFLAYGTTKFDIFASHLTILTHKNLKARLLFYLLHIAEKRKFTLDKSLEELAIYLCVERPSLSRVIRQLVDDGVITYSKGEGEIVDNVAIKELLE